MDGLQQKEKAGDVETSSRSSGMDIEADVTIGNHSPVLKKSFNLFSACATGMTTGNAWAVLGGGIVSVLVVFVNSRI